jgi:hypothetical protein
MKIFLFSSSEPAIESSNDLFFAPYNGAYPLQDEHFQKAGLDLRKTDLISVMNE